MLSKAKRLTPTPSNAARRFAQRARQFVWQCRSHSEADDSPGAAFVVPFFDFVGHVEFNPPATTLFQLQKTEVLGGLAHQKILWTQCTILCAIIHKLRRFLGLLSPSDMGKMRSVWEDLERHLRGMNLFVTSDRASQIPVAVMVEQAPDVL